MDNKQTTQAPAAPTTFSLGDGSKYDVNQNQLQGPTQGQTPPPTPQPFSYGDGKIAVGPALNGDAMKADPGQHLNDIQSANYQAVTDSSAPKTRSSIEDTLSTYLQSAGAQAQGYADIAKAYLPSVLNNPSAVQTYTQLRDQYKVGDLEAQQITTQQEAMKLQNTMRNTVEDIRKEAAASGGTVTESQIQFMASQRNKPLQRNLEDIQMHQQLVSDQLKQKTDLINTVSQLTGQDSDRALKVFDSFASKAQTSESNVMSFIKDFLAIQKQDASNKIAQERIDVQQQNADTQALRADNQYQQGQQRLDEQAKKDEQTALRDEQKFQVEQKRLDIMQQQADTSAKRADAYISRVASLIKGGGGASQKHQDAAVVAIIKKHPGEWGHAAAEIDKTFGTGTATKYDDLLKATYTKKETAATLTPATSSQLTDDITNGASLNDLIKAYPDVSLSVVISLYNNLPH